MKISLLGRCPNKTTNIDQLYSWMMKTTWQGLTLLGHTVQTLNYKTNSLEFIENELMRFEPDILFTHLTFHHWHDIHQALALFYNLREYIGTKVIHTMQDARLEPRYTGDLRGSFDLALVGNTEGIPYFKKYWKIPVHFWPYCGLTYDKMSISDSNLNFNGNPVFTGTLNAHNDRSQFINRLLDQLPIHIIQTKSINDLKNKTWELSASASCILALCTGYSILNYSDCRFWQYGAAGAFIIGRRFKGLDNIIPPKYYIPFDSYNNPNYVAKLIKKWIHLSMKDERNEIKKNIFNFMQKFHNSTVRMKQTLELINGERNKLDIFLKDLNI